MILNIIENKRIIGKFEIDLKNINFEFINLKDMNSLFVPDINGSYKIKDKMNDICSICTDNYNMDDLIVKWPECNHMFHKNCYNILRHKHNISNCPICRNSIKEVCYQSHIDLIFNDMYDLYTGKKYNDVSPIYIDNSSNINIRFKIFCKKYNFNIEEKRIFSQELNNISITKLINLISLISNNKIDEAKHNIKHILYKYISYNDRNLSIKNFQTIYENLKKFSQIDIFKIKTSNPEFSNIVNSEGFIELNLLIDSILNESIDILKQSVKKELYFKIKKFSKSIEGIIWFLTNNLSDRKMFYQKHLSKIGGEKYRKIFNAETYSELTQLISIQKI